MRLVRLKLRGCQFWNLPPIELNESKKVSSLLDIDLLSEEQVKVINQSVDTGDIKLTQSDGSLIAGNLQAANIVNGNYISDDDVVEDQMPPIQSVTVESEPKEEPEEKAIGPSDEVLSKATILLVRNGNTVKKKILALKKTDKNLTFLHACLIKEEEGKKRPGILQAIQQSISEY